LPICWETLAVLFGQQKVSDASIGFSAITGGAQVLTEKANCPKRFYRAAKQSKTPFT
jgi:hypothetical protein